MRQAASLPPPVLVRIAGRVVRAKVSAALGRRRDSRRSTRAAPAAVPAGSLRAHFQPPPLVALRAHADQLRALAELYRAHRFDLLGSGWVRVTHGMRCRGLEGHRYQAPAPPPADRAGRWLEGRINPANLAESRRTWRLVDEAYTPIDWQRDFKSGYRWCEATWHRDIRFGDRPGADVKVPWELARMQHLATLAWAHALAADGQAGFAPPATYAREFRNQVLDFLATNPPRFGVNWVCTMDVALRAASWLVAWDLLRAQGAAFDPPFEAELRRGLYEHGRHIVANLEWHPAFRGNHYLANVVGLLFLAAYLPRTPETDGWLAFATRELAREVGSQFTPDGASFEASTSYHRLSAEMVVYATALALGLPPERRAAWRTDDCPPLPAWYLERLEKMAEFTMHVTKPNGRVAQIGDNDSGRFLKLQPAYRRTTVAAARDRHANLDGYTELPDDADYWLADDLDHRHLVAAINGLFGRDDLAAFAGDGWLESDLVRQLAGGVRLPSYRQGGEPAAAARRGVGTREGWERLTAALASLPADQQARLPLPSPGLALGDDLAVYVYPDFGLYLFRSRRVYLAVRCGPVGQNGTGGHAHNDQLAIELSVDGEDWIADPGTYLYTPLPGWRNAYRGVAAHCAPRLGAREPARLDRGLFRLGDEARAECLYAGPAGFVGRHRGYGRPVYRVVELARQGVRVVDYVAGSGPPADRLEGGRSGPSVPLSPAYGVRLRDGPA